MSAMVRLLSVENSHLDVTPSNITTAARLSDSATPLFLMVNTLETGGSERQFAVLTGNINKSVFEVHLGCIDRRGPLAEQLRDVPEFPLGGSLYSWQSIRTRIHLSRHLRSSKVLIAHAFDFYANLTLIPAARFARVPVIIGSHRQLGDLLGKAKFQAQIATFRWCDAVLCNSEAAADHLLTAGVPREKLVVIGNALLPTAFVPAVAALPRDTNAPRLGMVARMNAQYKNHSGFLRIAAVIHKRMPRAQFVLVGDGPLRPEFERQAAAYGLSDRVYFLGDRQDIQAILASLDVAVLTSESESLSNAILEAMASRLPVVAYDVGGNRELINDDRGILVPARNEEEFANAVHRLLTDVHARRQLGGNARCFVEANFSLECICRRYEDLYITLLERKRGIKAKR